MQRIGWGMGAYHVMGQAEATRKIFYPKLTGCPTWGIMFSLIP